MDDETEELTAYHEAGHVVSALWLGGKIVRASIHPDWDDGPRRHGETVTVWENVSQTQNARSEVAVSLAGPVAESLYRSQALILQQVPEWQDDWSRATMSARLAAANAEEASGLLLATLASIQRAFQTDNGWAAVASIADLLLAHETVEHEQCADTVGFWMNF